MVSALVWRRTPLGEIEVGTAAVVVGMVIVVGRVGILVNWEVWCRLALGEWRGSEWFGLLPLRATGW